MAGYGALTAPHSKLELRLTKVTVDRGDCCEKAPSWWRIAAAAMMNAFLLLMLGTSDRIPRRCGTILRASAMASHDVIQTFKAAINSRVHRRSMPTQEPLDRPTKISKECRTLT